MLTQRGIRNKQEGKTMWGKRQKLTEKERKELRETGTTAGIGSTVMTRACLCNCLSLRHEREGEKSDSVKCTKTHSQNKQSGPIL